MIQIEGEPKELIEEFGIYEKCIFCDIPTNTWNEQTNKPVCSNCAETYDMSDLEELISL